MIINTPAVDRVEDLREDKGVEHKRLEDLLVVPNLRLAAVAEVEDLVTSEMQNENDRRGKDTLTDDLLAHLDREQRSRPTIGFPIKESRRRRVRRKSESSERVHDDVNPEQLHGRQHRRLRCGRHG